MDCLLSSTADSRGGGGGSDEVPPSCSKVALRRAGPWTDALRILHNDSNATPESRYVARLAFQADDLSAAPGGPNLFEIGPNLADVGPAIWSIPHQIRHWSTASPDLSKSAQHGRIRSIIFDCGPLVCIGLNPSNSVEVFPATLSRFRVNVARTWWISGQILPKSSQLWPSAASY